MQDGDRRLFCLKQGWLRTGLISKSIRIKANKKQHNYQDIPKTGDMRALIQLHRMLWLLSPAWANLY